MSFQLSMWFGPTVFLAPAGSHRKLGEVYVSQKRVSCVPSEGLHSEGITSWSGWSCVSEWKADESLEREPEVCRPGPLLCHSSHAVPCKSRRPGRDSPLQFSWGLQHTLTLVYLHLVSSSSCWKYLGPFES